MHILSPQACLSYAWKTFTTRPVFIIGSGILLFLVMVFSSLLQDAIKAIGSQAGAGTMAPAILAGIIGIVISFLVEMGRINFYLKLHDAVEAVTYRSFWFTKSAVNFVATSIIVGIATVIGFVLLIVPGIIVAIVFGFSLYLVIDKGLGPIEAMKESARLTKGNRWNLFLLGVLLVGINILGFLALLVGLLVTLPLSVLAVIHAYRTLSSDTPVQNEHDATPVVEAPTIPVPATV